MLADYKIQDIQTKQLMKKIHAQQKITLISFNGRCPSHEEIFNKLELL